MDKNFFNFEVPFGPLYENNMKNVQKIGAFILPRKYENFCLLTEISFFQEIQPFPENKAITFFDLCQI